MVLATGHSSRDIFNKLYEKNKNAKEIYEELQSSKTKIKVFAMIDTLEYLKKGGRVNAAVAIAGGMLNIKPVAVIEKGEIKMAGKARGSKNIELAYRRIKQCKFQT